MTTGETTEPFRPPLPRAAYRVLNPLMAALLRSPLHRLMSGSLMVLSFQGRKSGRRYQIPVGYVQRGDRLFVFSHSAWASNFRAGAPVAVRLRGQTLAGTATLVHERERIAEIAGLMVAHHGEAMARRMGLLADGQVGPRGVRFIEIALEAPRR